jgi:hypothetical protein
MVKERAYKERGKARLAKWHWECKGLSSWRTTGRVPRRPHVLKIDGAKPTTSPPPRISARAVLTAKPTISPLNHFKIAAYSLWDLRYILLIRVAFILGIALFFLALIKRAAMRSITMVYIESPAANALRQGLMNNALHKKEYDYLSWYKGYWGCYVDDKTCVWIYCADVLMDLHHTVFVHSHGEKLWTWWAN